MARLRPHLLSGTITDNPLLVGATSINSSGFASLPAVTTDTIDIVLDPDGVVGAPEIVRVTAHTASSTTVTVTRAADTTGGAGAARQHNTGEKWVVAALTPDFTHANLASLSADDHPQYHTDARHAAIVHLIGTEMNAPGTPVPVGLAASAGVLNNPAREDHVHQLGSTTTDGVTIHLNAGTGALEVKDGGISDAKVATGINGSKLTAGTVATAALADGAVTAVKHADFPNKRANNGTPAAQRNITSNTYVDMPTDSTTLSGGFTKKLASTRLVLSVAVSGFVSVGNTVPRIGMSVNGVDYDVAVMQFTTANQHTMLVGYAEVTGVAAFNAGTVKLRFQVGSNQFSMDGNDHWSYTIEESF